jgi:hypothetical protein
MTSELGRTIQTTLEEYTLPGVAPAYFAKVFRGEPLALTPSSRALARWHVLRAQPPPEGPRVLNNNRMTAIVYGIHCYWPLTPSEEAQGTQEDDIATVLIDLPNRFIDLTASDYTIGGYPVAGITVEDPSLVERVVPFADSGQAEMRTIHFELHARVLEAS